MQVWILTRGEDQESTTILGVYADKAIAFADFETAARDLHGVADIDSIDRGEDGSVYVHGGCDWVSLDPHTVATAPRVKPSPQPAEVEDGTTAGFAFDVA